MSGPTIRIAAAVLFTASAIGFIAAGRSSRFGSLLLGLDIIGGVVAATLIASSLIIDRMRAAERRLARIERILREAAKAYRVRVGDGSVSQMNRR